MVIKCVLLVLRAMQGRRCCSKRLRHCLRFCSVAAAPRKHHINTKGRRVVVARERKPQPRICRICKLA